MTSSSPAPERLSLRLSTRTRGQDVLAMYQPATASPMAATETAAVPGGVTWSADLPRGRLAAQRLLDEQLKQARRARQALPGIERRLENFARAEARPDPAPDYALEAGAPTPDAGASGNFGRHVQHGQTFGVAALQPFEPPYNLVFSPFPEGKGAGHPYESRVLPGLGLLGAPPPERALHAQLLAAQGERGPLDVADYALPDIWGGAGQAVADARRMLDLLSHIGGEDWVLTRQAGAWLGGSRLAPDGSLDTYLPPGLPVEQAALHCRHLQAGLEARLVLARIGLLTATTVIRLAAGLAVPANPLLAAGAVLNFIRQLLAEYRAFSATGM